MEATVETDAIAKGQIETFLQQLISELEPDPTPGGIGRPRVLPALCLWGGLLWCVLHGFTSQRALWRLLSAKGLWHYQRFPVTDQAIYNRLEREGTQALETLFTQVTQRLHARLAPQLNETLCPFATADVLRSRAL